MAVLQRLVFLLLSQKKFLGLQKHIFEGSFLSLPFKCAVSLKFNFNLRPIAGITNLATSVNIPFYTDVLLQVHKKVTREALPFYTLMITSIHFVLSARQTGCKR